MRRLLLVRKHDVRRRGVARMAWARIRHDANDFGLRFPWRDRDWVFGWSRGCHRRQRSRRYVNAALAQYSLEQLIERPNAVAQPRAPQPARTRQRSPRSRGVDRRSDAKVDEASAPGSAACEVRLHLTQRGPAGIQSPRKPNGLSHCIFECLIVEASSQAQNHLSVLADRYTERCRGVFDCTGDG